MLRSTFLDAIGASMVAQGFPLLPGLPGAQQQVGIALCAPLSGAASNLGKRLSAGVQAAIQYNNELGTSLQHVFAMRPYDDQNAAANASLVSSFAVGDANVVAAIGHVNADATLQGIRNYGPAGLPLVVPVCTDDRVTATQYRSVFRLPTKDSFEGQIFASTVLAQYKPKLPYVFVQDADYGADVANGFISAMSAQKVTAQYQQFSYDHPDFGAVVDKALAVQPDYVFLAGIVGDMGPIVGVLRAKGYTGPIGASQGFFDAATLKIGPAADGMMVSTSMPYLTFAPVTLRWRQDFETHYGPLDPLAAFGYAAAQLIMAAVNRVTSASRGTTLQALQQSTPVDTMTGSYQFGVFGDALQPQLYYYTIKGGKIDYLKPAHPSTFILK